MKHLVKQNQYKLEKIAAQVRHTYTRHYCFDWLLCRRISYAILTTIITCAVD